MKFKKLPLPLIAFAQAFLITLYCFIVVNFINWVDKTNFGENLYGPLVMLALLVFSAALCGFLFFAYAIYLLLEKEIKPALRLLAYTFLFLLLFILLTFLMIFI